MILFDRGVATNNGLGGAGRSSSNRDLFCIVTANMVLNSQMFFHIVNNIEHIKNNASGEITKFQRNLFFKEHS